MKKTTHRLYNPTDAILKDKEKKEKSPPSPLLTVGCVGAKIARKLKICRCKIKVPTIFSHKSKTLAFQILISYKRTSKELQKRK